ncbi:ferric reductase like transmembrane component domain-containing protein [Trichoderma austrokoningii]
MAMTAVKYFLRVLLALVGLFPWHGLSLDITVHQECVAAVFGIIGNLNFEGIGYGDYYTGICQNPLKVTSVYAISKAYCPPNDLDTGFAYFGLACQSYGSVELIPEADVAINLTDKAIGSFPILDQDDERVLTNLTTPILISRDWFELGFRTEDAWDYEQRTHIVYGYAMYGFWGGVLVIGFLHRLITLVNESRLSSSSIGPEDTGIADSRKKQAQNSGLFVSMYSWIRKNLITPSALPPYRRQPLFGCTIPTRIEVFIVLSYWIVSFVLCCVNYRGFKGNLYWSAVAPQIWRYIADRAGIMAYSNLPLMWMFSGRNNVFIWLTGWQFSTFNLFHRHIARIATLQAIFHSIAYTAFYFTSGDAVDYRASFHEIWWCLGIMATISMSFIVLLSFSWFRRKIYESFLLIHIVLSVVVIVALFYHTSIFDGQYNPYLWPLVAIWSFDRFLRIIRVVYCNLHVRLHEKALHRSVAAISYDQDANVVRIQINTHVKPKPGQHYYLYQPFRFTGWENHPFTLAYWSQPARETVQIQANSFATDSAKYPSSKIHAAAEDEYILSFWIRPYDGWTRRLRDMCLKSQSASKLSLISRETILLEGPYGMAEPLWAFDEVLLIAGGSGIAAMIPYILDHVSRTAAGQTRIRGLTLIWSDRKQAYLHRIAQRELAVVLARDDVKCVFYCTDSAKVSIDSLPLPSPDEISVGNVCKETKECGVFRDKEAANDINEAGSISFKTGRPDIPKLIEGAAVSAVKSGSRLAVMACGPSELADTAREATHRAMRNQSNSVEYFEEAFGW